MEAKKLDLSNRLFWLGIILVAGIVATLLVNAYTNSSSVSGNYPREISVSAQGKSIVKPDIAVVQLGYTNEGQDSATVITENNDKMKAVSDEVKKLGVEEKDIHTVNYNFSPKYNWTEGRGNFVDGYTLTQEIEVKIRDFTKINDIMQKASEAGVNVINQLTFSVDDPQKAKEVAMKEAVTKAKSKAQSIANASGLRLGRLVNVYEDGNTPVANNYSEAKMVDGMGGGNSAVSSPDIQPGQQEISVNMTLVYRLK